MASSLLYFFPVQRIKREEGGQMDGLARKAGVTISIIVFIFLITPIDLLADSLIWAPPELGDLIDEGLEQNKEIQNLENQVESLKELIPFAGSLPDPRLGIGALNVPTDTFSFNQEPMTQKQIFMAPSV